jgi:hypothetical protein
VIASFAIDNGSITEIELTPISLGFDQNRVGKGKPKLADKEQGERILEELNELSLEFGTKVTIRNGKGYITL